MISQADNNKKQNWFIPLSSKKVLILIFVKMCQGDYCQEFSATRLYARAGIISLSFLF